MKTMPASSVTHIVIHNTDSDWGDVAEVRRWHTLPPPKGNGWSDVAYHYLILNQYPTYGGFSKKKPSPSHDGVIQPGRPTDRQGAHEQKYNDKSIGVCLVGKAPPYTEAQMRSLRALVRGLMLQYKVPHAKVIGHQEVDGKKRDPGFNMDVFRASL